MRFRRWIVLILALASQTAWSCPVCFSATEQNRMAFILTTVFLSFLPLCLIAAMIWAYKWRLDQQNGKNPKGFDRLIAPYFKVLKVRMVIGVQMATGFGFIMARESITQHSFHVLFFCLIGAGLAAAGSFVLNQSLEHEHDALMKRTRKRPIVKRDITPMQGLIYGHILALGGVLWLWYSVNLLTAFLTLLVVFMYVLVYTPLKRLTWFNTYVGAVPGALPCLIGWSAASGGLTRHAWLLFFLLFVWQHVHFFAIAWMHRDDYARAGFRMLSVEKPGALRTSRLILFYAICLLPISISPTLFGMTGIVYATGAALLGMLILYVAYACFRSLTDDTARRVFQASLVYVPALLIIAVVDTSLMM